MSCEPNNRCRRFGCPDCELEAARALSVTRASAEPPRTLRPDCVKCVLVGGDPVATIAEVEGERTRRRAVTWCGRAVGGQTAEGWEWTFFDASHAALNARQEGRLLICPQCAHAIGAVIAKGAWMPPSTPPDQDKNAPVCTHGLTFDEAQAKGLSVREIRARWPRLFGACPLGCGFDGIAYVSSAHFLYGDW